MNTAASPANGGNSKPFGPMVVEKHYRSLAKAISYRLTGTVSTTLIALAVTGRLKPAFCIGFIEFFAKIGVYYIHERVWDRFNFGRARVLPDYEI